jgi:hypothetical protein
MDDVKTEAEATAVETSIDEPITQEPSQEAATETQAPVEDLESKAVPYSRFKEVNEELKGLRGTIEQMNQRMQQPQAPQAPQAPVNPEEAQVRQALSQLGYKSADEIRAEMQQTLAQERQNIRVEQQLTGLESKYNGTNGQPKFDRQEVVKFALEKGIGDPEVAYKALKERELMDWHIKQAIAKSAGTKSEASDGSGSSTAAGTANSDLKQAAMQGDQNSLHTYLKRIIG